MPTSGLGQRLIEALADIVKETITERERQLKQLPFLETQIRSYLRRVGQDA